MEALGEISGAGKTHFEGNFSNIASILFQQLRGSLESHGADELAGGLIYECAQLTMQANSAHIELLSQLFNMKFRFGQMFGPND